MRYRATVHIGIKEIEDLRHGRLVLQAGQWVRLAWSATKSRWVGISRGGSLWLAHWEGGHDGSKFAALCEAIK